VNPDLQLFVRDALARGLPRTAIREKLLQAGWRPEEVESALGSFAEVDFPVPVPRRRPYVSAREAFLYLVLFATLYITAFNVGVVLFAILDRWLPDVAQAGHATRQAVAAVRGGIAALVIAFPIFLFLSTLIGRSLAREPEKRGSKVRKWLTYLTLFVAALVLIADLTFLVQRLLSGELPLRVLLKTLVVFAIAGTVFGHYLADLRREERDADARSARPGLLARAAVVAVLVVIVAGLVGSGSPGRERLRVMDARRVEHLKSITGAVETYADGHRRLPAALTDLIGPNSQTGRWLRDPATQKPYEYRILDSLSYQLCATFDIADSLAGPGVYGEVSEFWRHPAGRWCFTVQVPPPRLRER
jgi:hypothetical protein